MASAAYTENRAFSDRFTPKIKEIVGRALCSRIVMESSTEDDCLRASDLILAIDKVRIACRVRRASEQNQRYHDEFTLRARVSNGSTKTEMEKVLGGWGDYIFYGFGTDAGELARWFIGDLREFREWHYRKSMSGGKPPGQYKANDDGSAFFAFSVLELSQQSKFIVMWKGFRKEAQHGGLLD